MCGATKKGRNGIIGRGEIGEKQAENGEVTTHARELRRSSASRSASQRRNKPVFDQKCRRESYVGEDNTVKI
jgi:hypothetical protein